MFVKFNILTFIDSLFDVALGMFYCAIFFR